ncbi:MAG: hypothetical protein U9Q27_03520 [Patescibacteria group bacterium]|nr:hypothetical protein [Patescibacteria group bacterium]
MKKKVVIKSLKFKNSKMKYVSVGKAFVPEGILVEKIVYEERYYNKGHQGRFSAYVVFLVDSNIRHIIRETEISVVTVEIQNIEDKQEVPDLPEKVGGKINAKTAIIDQPNTVKAKVTQPLHLKEETNGGNNFE